MEPMPIKSFVSSSWSTTVLLQTGIEKPVMGNFQQMLPHDAVGQWNNSTCHSRVARHPYLLYHKT